MGEDKGVTVIIKGGEVVIIYVLYNLLLKDSE